MAHTHYYLSLIEAVLVRRDGNCCCCYCYCCYCYCYCCYCYCYCCYHYYCYCCYATAATLLLASDTAVYECPRRAHCARCGSVRACPMEGRAGAASSVRWADFWSRLMTGRVDWIGMLARPCAERSGRQQCMYSAWDDV